MRRQASRPPRTARRYRVGVTRRHHTRASQGLWRRVLPILTAALLTVILALVIGNSLLRRSDDYHAAQAAGEWTADTSAPLPQVTAGALRGSYVRPDGETPQTIGGATCAVLRLSENPDGRLDYILPEVLQTGLETETNAPSLAAEVSRLHSKGLRVVGVFEVQCLNEPYLSGAPQAVLRRGVEQSLLLSAAEAGVDELLLLGCPQEESAITARVLPFLQELKEQLTECAPATALGVAMPPEAFVRIEGETAPAVYGEDTSEEGIPQYTGWRVPGQLLSVCDRLVVDLRGTAVEGADTLLCGFRHSYARWGLTLLLSDTAVSELADIRGMTNQLLVEYQTGD